MEKMTLELICTNPLVIPILIAKKKGLFEKHGLNMTLNLLEDFNFGGPSSFMQGTSDGVMGDVTFYFYFREQGKEAVITSTLTRTIQLIGRKDITLPAKGLKVGVNRKGLFRLYLEHDLGALLQDVEIRWYNNTYERMAALEAGEIDALVAIDPFAYSLTQKGYKILWHSKDSDKNMVMWAFDKTYYETHKLAISAFYKATAEAIKLFNACLAEEKEVLAQSVGYNKQLAMGIKDLEFEEEVTYSKEDFELCEAWMYREKEIINHYEAKDCIVEC